MFSSSAGHMVNQTPSAIERSRETKLHALKRPCPPCQKWYMHPILSGSILSSYVTWQARCYQKLFPHSTLQSSFYQRWRRIPDNTLAGSQFISRMNLKVMIYAKGITTKSIAAFIIWRIHSSRQILGFCKKIPSQVGDLLFWGKEPCGSGTERVLSIMKNHSYTEIFGSALTLLQEKTIVPSWGKYF